MSEERLGAALRRLVAEPEVPDALAERVAARYARRRAVRAGVTVAVAAVGVGAVAVAPGLLRSRQAPPPVAASESPTASPAPRADLPPGPRYHASGAVVVAPGGDAKFCPSLDENRNTWGPWGGAVSPTPRTEAPRCGESGVPVHGVDAGRLAGREELAGTVWGRAWLMGVYTGGELHVVEQGDPRPEPLDGTGRDAREEVPCAPPPGGWAQDEAFDDPYAEDGSGRGYQQPSLRAAEKYADDNPGVVVHLRFAIPEPNHSVVLVIATDAERADAALRDDYPRSLCVVQTKFSRAQVVAARKDVQAIVGNGVSSGGGYRASLDGQVAVGLEAEKPTPEIDAVLARHPKGLIQPVYWLRPYTGEERYPPTVVHP